MQNSQLRILTSLVFFVNLLTGFEITEKQREILLRATVEYEKKISKNEEIVPFPCVITPPPPPIKGPDWRPEVDSYLLLPYIIFDPLGQFPTFREKTRKVYCHLCAEDGKMSVLSRGNHNEWNNGRRNRSNPRMLFDVESPLLLVSKVYKCEHGHNIPASYCHGVSEAYMYSSFRLTHRSGITVRLSDDIVDVLDRGLAISTVEDLIKERYKRTVRNRLLRFFNDTGHAYELGFTKAAEALNVEVIDDYFPCPSDNLIRNLYITSFEEKKQLFTSAMNSLNAKWISCDHTFKAAANIGFERKEDGTWITQYTSLFCIVNEKGQVIRWSFAMSESFDDVKPLFEALSSDFRRRGVTLSGIYIDNCCKWRHLLALYFPNVPVKLDLFHAIQRITRKVSKRSHIFQELCKDYSLVFRDQRDQASERKLPTPPPEEILRNLNNFISKWVSVKNSSDSCAIINKSIEKELKNIECHIRKGCLSDIPPGCGTTRNERLHRELKKTTVTNRIGVDLARTRIERTLFNANRKRDETLPSIDHMLIGNAKTTVRTKIQERGRTNNTSNKDEEKQVFQIENTTERKVINLKRITVGNISEIQTRLTTLIDRSSDESLSDEEDAENLLNTDFQNLVILRDALQWWKMSKIVEEKLGTKLFNFKKLITYVRPLKMRASPEIDTVHNEAATTNERKRLTELASTWGFGIVEVTGDGNCLFTAVATQLQQMLSLNARDKPSLLMSHLKEQVGIDVSSSVSYISSILRRQVVQELKGERVEYYQSFLPSEVNIISEADRFRQSGTFSGPLGDLIPLAIANVIQIPLFVLNPSYLTPFMMICPESMVPAQEAVYLAYNGSGPGHYDALVIQSQPEQGQVSCESTRTENIDSTRNGSPLHMATSVTSTPRKPCRCGEKKKYCDKTQPVRNYKGRCKCIKEYGTCMSTCNCCGSCQGENCG